MQINKGLFLSSVKKRLGINPKVKVTEAKQSFPRSIKGRTKGETGLQTSLNVKKAKNQSTLKIDGESPMTRAKKRFKAKYGYDMTSSKKKNLLSGVGSKAFSDYKKIVKEEKKIGHTRNVSHPKLIVK